jgi:catechol 2,3-dioxygenase-like lactoylglutathione lyase family enzyme
MSSDAAVIRKTDFVFVPVRDFATAEAFYGTTLGLPCSARYGDGIGGEFETGNLTIQLLEAERIGRRFTPTSGAIALGVDDVHRARSILESRGVKFTGDVIDSGVCLQAFFHDPDGNPLILHHRYAPKETS